MSKNGLIELTICDTLPCLKLKTKGDLTDIDGIKREFTIDDKPIVVQQTTYPNKIFILQKIRFTDTGIEELRLGYYIIGKKPGMRGRWVWGQYCPFIPQSDFKKLVNEAQKRGWL